MRTIQHKSEIASIASLQPHPKNYRDHPDDQITHLAQSIKEFGVYRNVVVSKDGVILAGHGIVKAAKSLKLTEIPIIRLGIKSTDRKALKLLVGDNEIEHLAEQNDRQLAELLKSFSLAEDLLGTGFDQRMVASFTMVTRPESEIKTFDEAAAWLGMPKYEGEVRAAYIVVSFKTVRDREKFKAKLGIQFGDKTKSIWWPMREKEDRASLKFKDKSASNGASSKVGA